MTKPKGKHRILSPEEQLLHDLVNLAVTIRDDGQVNPLTVVDATQGVTRLYRIETGERRYWATWLLRDFIPGYESDGMLPCIIIPAERASAFRQAKENTARTGLSAIAMARQAALLLLYVHGCEIPDGPVTHDFYRQALELTLRGKREYTSEILSAMGGIGSAMFSRHKSLLRLCDEAIELADRHNLDEGRLRHLLELSPDDQIEMARQIIQLNLSAKQIIDLVNSPNTEAGNSSADLPRQVRQLVRLMRPMSELSGYNLALALVEQEGDAVVARVRLQHLRQLLDETETYFGITPIKWSV